MLNSVLNLAAFSSAIDWLVERNLPLIVALLLPGEADPKLEQRLKSLVAVEKPFLLERVSPSISLKASRALKSPQSSDHQEKKPAPEPRTRSWKVPFKERNKVPDAVYKAGDVVWLTIEGEHGSFRVDIVTDGKWSESDQAWQYQVRQTDGELYDNGALVGEGDLHRGKK